MSSARRIRTLVVQVVEPEDVTDTRRQLLRVSTSEVEHTHCVSAFAMRPTARDYLDRFLAGSNLDE